jgi:hypothetical protein
MTLAPKNSSRKSVFGWGFTVLAQKWPFLAHAIAQKVGDITIVKI